MTDLFYTTSAPNRFDNLQIDVAQLYAVFARSPFHHVYRSPLPPLRYRRGFYRLDTHHAVRQRSTVLDFIEGHFRLRRGTLARNRSLGITFVQRPA